MTTAADKQAAIWASIQGSPYPGTLPDQPDADLVRGLAVLDDKNSYMMDAFEARDTAPPSRDLPRQVDPSLARRKLFHGVGTCALVELVPVAGHPYTGLLKTGGIGIVRASVAHTKVVKPDHERQAPLSPGIGLKLFVDDTTSESPSRNLVAVFRLEGVPWSPLGTHFLEWPLSTTIQPPTPRLPGPMDLAPDALYPMEVAKWHALMGVFQNAMVWRYTAREHPNVLAVDVHPMCAVEPDGSAVTDVVAPDRLVFEATDAAKAAMSTELDFRLGLAALWPDGTQDGLLYRVSDGERPVAELRVRSGFRTSVYGDDVLFFQHTAHAARSAQAP
ncbi:MAG: hypothetical protein H6736_00565 [Alphaproteobacteria bacterium]|nr:hypothetical protein [Alphaproteobacteria bacterium]